MYEWVKKKKEVKEEKMKKTKLIAILSAFVILAAMTGIAAADPADINIADNPIINPLDGSTVTTTTADVTAISYATMGSPHTRYISVKTTDANLYARVTGNGVDTGWTNNVRVGGTYTATSPNDYSFTVEVKGTQEGQVSVADNEGDQYYEMGSNHDEAACTRDVLIPEFATIAIPAVAILGLFLFFNHRKRREN